MMLVTSSMNAVYIFFMFAHERGCQTNSRGWAREGHSSALQLGGKSAKLLPCPRNRSTCGIQVAIGNIRYVRIPLIQDFLGQCWGVDGRVSGGSRNSATGWANSGGAADTRPGSSMFVMTRERPRFSRSRYRNVSSLIDADIGRLYRQFGSASGGEDSDDTLHRASSTISPGMRNGLLTFARSHAKTNPSVTQREARGGHPVHLDGCPPGLGPQEGEKNMG